INACASKPTATRRITITSIIFIIFLSKEDCLFLDSPFLFLSYPILFLLIHKSPEGYWEYLLVNERIEFPIYKERGKELQNLPNHKNSKRLQGCGHLYSGRKNYYENQP
ncbi:hypothetical protein, partial [Niallia taxi]|uniref:hypothetical protein n=1 Tax=Niallia taxi TaxID=2499688 RepID=UPI0030096D99